VRQLLCDGILTLHDAQLQQNGMICRSHKQFIISLKTLALEFDGSNKSLRKSQHGGEERLGKRVLRKGNDWRKTFQPIRLIKVKCNNRIMILSLKLGRI